jgi:DNA-binding transcriptional regulator YhcF (GntR family)
MEKQMKTGSYDIAMGGRSMHVFLELQKEIESGRYAKGSKLPTEFQLCERFGASRPTVRRALSNLAGEGLISIRRGDGMYILWGGQKKQEPQSKAIAIMSQFDQNILIALQDYLLRKGYLMPCYHQTESNWDLQLEKLFLEGIKNENLSGLLAFCSPHGSDNSDLLAEIANSSTRVIHIGPYKTELPAEEYIMFDYYKAGYLGAVTLMVSDYEKIMLASLRKSPHEALIEKGFLDALRDQNREDDYVPYDIPTGIKNLPRVSAEVVDYLNGFKGKTGILTVAAPFANDLYELRERYNKKMPDEIGLLTISELPYMTSEHVDSLEFNRLDIMTMAIDMIIDNKKPAKILEPPVLKKKGTLR